MARNVKCKKCGQEETLLDLIDHECLPIICPTCFLTKPCECDDD